MLSLIAALSAFSVYGAGNPQPPYPTNNDPTNQIRFDTPAEADAKRQQLTTWIWSGGLPTSTPAVTKNISFPSVLNGINQAYLSGIDKLDANVSGMDFHSISYLLHPQNVVHADRLVIVHQGHVKTVPDESLTLGIGTLTNRLLAEGYTVALMQMPLCGWNTDNTLRLPDGTRISINGTRTDAHNDMFAKLTPPTLADGAVFCFFLEPVVQTVNYFLSTSTSPGPVSMIGLSGGAWTTHLISAIDPRVQLSIPVAGSAPLYVRNEGIGVGDYEQVYPPLYDENIGPKPEQAGGGVATWLEIYALGGYGAQRRQIMVTNKFEPSTLFAGTFPDTFKDIVSGVVRNDLRAGKWEHVYDTSHTEHQISSWTIENVILPALQSLEVPEPGACGQAVAAGAALSSIVFWQRLRFGRLCIRRKN